MSKKTTGYPRTVVRGGKTITFTKPVSARRAAAKSKVAKRPGRS